MKSSKTKHFTLMPGPIYWKWYNTSFGLAGLMLMWAQGEFGQLNFQTVITWVSSGSRSTECWTKCVYQSFRALNIGCVNMAKWESMVNCADPLKCLPHFPSFIHNAAGHHMSWRNLLWNERLMFHVWLNWFLSNTREQFKFWGVVESTLEMSGNWHNTVGGRTECLIASISRFWEELWKESNQQVLYFQTPVITVPES